MACDSTNFVYVANAGVNGITAIKGAIPLGSVVRQHTGCRGPAPILDGNGITCKGSGSAFHIHGHVTLSQVDTSGSAPPTISISLLQNGSTVQGSRVSATSSGTVTLPVDSVIRNDCCSSSVLTLLNTGVAVNIDNLALTVEPV